MDQARIILHADMDAFYASIEQRDDPRLEGQPVIVGANSPRGVVAAASYEARQFGVRSAMPGFRARELCPHAFFLPARMSVYSAVSEQIQRVFSEFTPEVEPLSLDEAFLEVTGSAKLFGGPLPLARRLKARVREETRLAVSVGIAPSKLVAKIACARSKPDGLLWVRASAVEWLLDPLPIRALWGVGPVMAAALERAGIRTVGEIGRAPAGTLARAVGDHAEQLRARARGDDVRPVESARAARSIGEENTFERDVRDRETITATLTAHAEAVARRLRREALRGRTVTLKIKLARPQPGPPQQPGADRGEPLYPCLTRSRTLAAATDDGALIRREVIELWDRAAINEPVRLVGVSLSGLDAGGAKQLDLFATGSGSDRLGQAMDAIEERFGRGAIRRAVDDPGKITHGNTRKRGE